ncbi:MAG: dephospho-CoA kinase [Bacilli bacterium]|nr:dephospho-CoA kinase [Bacilli bacterium]
MLIGICGKSGSGKSTLARSIIEGQKNNSYIEDENDRFKELLYERIRNEFVNTYGKLDYNAIHVDVDKIGHKALLDEDVKKELINSFGKEILSDEVIDRKKLGDLVFNSRSEMKKLSDITWRYMEKEIDSIIENNKDKVIILDWILLPLTKYFKMCRYRILLDVDYELRKSRVLLRDNISEDDFELRDSSSIEYDKDDFDFVITIKEAKRVLKI